MGAFLIIYSNLAAGFIISYFAPTVGLRCRFGGYLIFGVLTLAAALGEASPERFTAPSSIVRRAGHYSLTVLEFVNTCWLIWITLAQTFSFYHTCHCEASTWAWGGGYIHFGLEIVPDPSIAIIWSLGTAIAGTMLACSLLYIVTQWCEQSHLMTADYNRARKGLMWTRRVKRARACHSCH